MTARLRAAALATFAIAAAFDSASAEQGARASCLMQGPPAVYALRKPVGGDRRLAAAALDALAADGCSLPQENRR
jgi:hypothetical protein